MEQSSEAGSARDWRGMDEEIEIAVRACLRAWRRIQVEGRSNSSFSYYQESLVAPVDEGRW